MNGRKMLFSESAENLCFEPHSVINSSSPIILRFIREHKENKATSNIHENIEILAFFDGVGSVRCNQDLYEVGAGDTVVVNSFVEHQIVYAEKPVGSCIIIDAGFCKINGVDIHRLNFTPFIHDGELTRLVLLLREEYNKKGPFRDTAIKCALINLLLYLCRNFSQQREDAMTLGNKSIESVCMAVDYIKSSFDKRISVDKVADAVNLSRYYFMREFKRITGHTVIEYINLIRCERAVELLMCGKYNVKEIAVRLGYDDVSYFTKMFKKTTSHLPSDFLKS